MDNKTHTIASKIVKEIVLPELEREVNEDKNFAALRQVYSGMLLAAWYKRALKESLLSRIYANKAKVKGVDQDPKTNEQIYRQYLRAYKKGVFNFIKEDVDKYTNETIPRKYFSGGGVGITQAARDLGMKVLGNKDKGEKALIETTSAQDAAQTAIEQVGNNEDDMAMIQAEEEGEKDTAQAQASSQGATPVALQEKQRLLNEPAVSEFHSQIGALEGAALKDFYDRYDILRKGRKIIISAQILTPGNSGCSIFSPKCVWYGKSSPLGIIAGKTIEAYVKQVLGIAQEEFVPVGKYTSEASQYSVYLKHYAGVYTFVIKSRTSDVIEVALGTGQENVARSILLNSEQFPNVVKYAISASLNPGRGYFEGSRKILQTLLQEELSKNAAMKSEDKLENILKGVQENHGLNSRLLDKLANLKEQPVGDNEVDILIEGIKGAYGMNLFLPGRVGLSLDLMRILGFGPKNLSAANAKRIVNALKDFWGLNGPEHADAQLNEIISSGFDYREMITHLDNAIQVIYGLIFDGKWQNLPGNAPMLFDSDKPVYLNLAKEVPLFD